MNIAYMFESKKKKSRFSWILCTENFKQFILLGKSLYSNEILISNEKK